jgi:putative phosphoesterase
MRIAVISDIHGNLPALVAVLREIDEAGVDMVVVGGDVAGGPMPRQTIERLMALGGRARFVRGNGDREMLASFDGEPPAPERPERVHQVITWCAAQMDRGQRDFLAGFVDRLVVDVDGLGAVLCCHASPRNDMDVFTERSTDDEVRPFFAGVEQRVVTCGHTHMQFERDLDGIHIVNVGSVGMPYGAAGAFWALLGPDVVLRRTAYDLERAADLVRRTDFPLAGEFADRNVLSPPSAEDFFDYIRRMAERQS